MVNEGQQHCLNRSPLQHNQTFWFLVYIYNNNNNNDNNNNNNNNNNPTRFVEFEPGLISCSIIPSYIEAGISVNRSQLLTHNTP